MNSSFAVETFINNDITKRTESLFAKDLVQYHTQIKKEIENKTVLVIGGAGTIGSSFIKIVLRYKPAKLVVVDISENGLTELVRDCRSRNDISLPASFKTYPINFGDPVFRKMFIAEGGFDVVANFAAHKHVRSEKDVFSIEAMIDNNVCKVKELLDLLLQIPPKHFFCVSTDKAANSASIMGASKKLMEDVILAYTNDIKITTARFANVAFSNGSLLAGFLERLYKQQPLSCPSDVSRYFVSPSESGEICLLACVLGNSGDIFFPKLNAGDMVNFKDIALSFLQSLHYQPDVCATEEEAKNKATLLTDNSTSYPVYFFASETSGEKLYEEFYTEEEEVMTASFSSVGIIKNVSKKSLVEVGQIVKELKSLFQKEVTKSDIVAAFSKLMPGFAHIETGLNLDQKM